MAEVTKSGDENVTGGVVPGTGHWIMEENPAATMKLVRDFLEKPRPASSGSCDRLDRAHLQGRCSRAGTPYPKVTCVSLARA